MESKNIELNYSNLVSPDTMIAHSPLLSSLFHHFTVFSEYEVKACSFPFFAGGPYIAAMVFYNLLYNEEKNIPILMVSAKKDDIDKIRGLGLGADDYMTKPFSPSELVARVKAHLARYDRLTGSAVEKNK